MARRMSSCDDAWRDLKMTAQSSPLSQTQDDAQRMLKMPRLSFSEYEDDKPLVFAWLPNKRFFFKLSIKTWQRNNKKDKLKSETTVEIIEHLNGDQSWWIDFGDGRTFWHPSSQRTEKRWTQNLLIINSERTVITLCNILYQDTYSITSICLWRVRFELCLLCQDNINL